MNREAYLNIRNTYSDTMSLLYAVYKEKGGTLTPTQFGVSMQAYVSYGYLNPDVYIKSLDGEYELFCIQDLKTNKIIKWY